MLKPLLTSIALVLLQLFNYSQNCDTTLLINYLISASQTDPNIAFELPKHYVWYNPDCSPKNSLVVYLPGTYANPLSTTYFPKLAANLGYHVIGLKYPNNVAARTACENSTDIDCYKKFRKEVLEGQDYSPHISVDSVNSIYNRLYRLLVHLHTANPSEGWDAYFDTSINWSNIIVAGHSLGGGHAALIAQENQVKRLIMFASPNDYSIHFNAIASWINDPFITHDSLFYGFGNLFDDIVDFPEQYEIWNSLNMSNYGDTIDINNISSPYNNTRMLYSKDMTTGVSGNHNIVVFDASTPLNTDGSPKYTDVWEYLLGLPISTANLSKNENLSSFQVSPNPTLNEFTIEFHQSNEHIIDFKLMNLQGQIVFEKLGVYNTKLTIQTNEFESGVYFYQIVTKNWGTLKGKIIKV